MTARAYVRTALIVLVTLLIQSTVVLDIRVAGAHPDLMLLLPIAAGLVGEPEEAAIVGFVAGIAADLVLPTPFGLTALVGCVVGFVIASGVTASMRSVRLLMVLVALIASAASVMLYAVLGAVLGQQQFLHVDLAAVATVVAVANGVLVLPAVAVMRWVLAPPHGSPRQQVAQGTRLAGDRW